MIVISFPSDDCLWFMAAANYYFLSSFCCHPSRRSLQPAASVECATINSSVHSWSVANCEYSIGICSFASSSCSARLQTKAACRRWKCLSICIFSDAYFAHIYIAFIFVPMWCGRAFLCALHALLLIQMACDFIVYGTFLRSFHLFSFIFIMHSRSAIWLVCANDRWPSVRSFSLGDYFFRFSFENETTATTLVRKSHTVATAKWFSHTHTHTHILNRRKREWKMCETAAKWRKDEKRTNGKFYQRLAKLINGQPQNRKPTHFALRLLACVLWRCCVCIFPVAMITCHWPSSRFRLNGTLLLLLFLCFVSRALPLPPPISLGICADRDRDRDRSTDYYRRSVRFRSAFYYILSTQNAIWICFDDITLPSR